MHLEKLEIQGFKSFASKNVLVFPGMTDKDKRGITAVVGPNGAGKSNIADAVRWALGEQSMKILRGKKAEDVIFSGSDKKGRLGMAEVSLFLNNESALDYGSGQNQALTDYSQIVITRRLYRNGDSEYMINNNRVRLSDVQMLLARAKFGQKTYSVIGQGMVESFLNTSLAERKEFFDEATGVKQYQIKRDESLNKLRSSYENLAQTQMLISEIEPRLKSLTRQVNRLRRRSELEQELKKWQTGYYRSIWHDIDGKFSDYNKRYLELEKVRLDKNKKQIVLTHQLKQLEIDSHKEREFYIWQDKLNEQQNIKDNLNKKLARTEAQMEVKLEAGGKFDLSFLFSKEESLGKEIGVVDEELIFLKKNIEDDEERERELDKKKESISCRINDLTKKLAKANMAADPDRDKETNAQFREILLAIEGLEQEQDIAIIKKTAKKIKDKIKRIIFLFGFSGEEGGLKYDQLQDTQESLEKLRLDKETALIKINDNKLRISARQERVKLLKEKSSSLNKELAAINEKLSQNSNKPDLKKLENERADFKKQLLEIQAKILTIKERISQANKREARQKERLFDLQKNSQSLQGEIDKLNNESHELKISSTRYETKLEDLEIEIRQELGGLLEIKKQKNTDEFNIQSAKEKIDQLKHQLELIGGIDPQTEEEYSQTKERFDFLSGQVNDFTKAAGSLEKIIKELDAVIKEQFDKEFKVIAQKFEKYFKILFNGGSAKIIKVMENLPDKSEEGEESGHKEPQTVNAIKKTEIIDIQKIKFLQKHNATGLAGIEIQATPPGKKIKSISMLSGGERAMAAIALICAIISVNPSPFVVLDEVDAALDEANSERLVKILEELSYKTQFISITHNRAFMRKANILYGITMGDDGVSKLLSIKLDKAC